MRVRCLRSSVVLIVQARLSFVAVARHRQDCGATRSRDDVCRRHAAARATARLTARVRPPAPLVVVGLLTIDAGCATSNGSVASSSSAKRRCKTSSRSISSRRDCRRSSRRSVSETSLVRCNLLTAVGSRTQRPVCVAAVGALDQRATAAVRRRFVVCCCCFISRFVARDSGDQLAKFNGLVASAVDLEATTTQRNDSVD